MYETKEILDRKDMYKG